MFQGDQRASLSSLSGDLASIISRYRISKGRAADAQAKRSLEETLPHVGAGRLGCDHGCPGPGADTLIFGAGFRDWCFNLTGTVGSGVGARVLCLNRVSLVLHFPGMYGGPAPQKSPLTMQVAPTSASITTVPEMAPIHSDVRGPLPDFSLYPFYLIFETENPPGTYRTDEVEPRN